MRQVIAFTVLGFTALCFLIGISFATSISYRYYQVWSMEMRGKALLAEAAQTRQILIETAKAEKEAAVERAEAIKIIGDIAKKYPEYRNQEYIMAFGEALKEGRIHQIIYVPTEANIPILEAGKR